MSERKERLPQKESELGICVDLYNSNAWHTEKVSNQTPFRWSPEGKEKNSARTN